MAHEGVRGNGPLRSENGPLRRENGPLRLMGNSQEARHGGKQPLLKGRLTGLRFSSLSLVFAEDKGKRLQFTTKNG